MKRAAPIQPMAVLILLGGLGLVAQLYATAWGGGVSPDSSQYIAGARNLLVGEGLSAINGDGQYIPITLWPPLYPFILAAPGMLGVDAAAVGRWLNAVLLGVNIALVGYLVYRYANRSFLASVVSALVFLISPDALAVHVWIWTEPLFIALSLSAMYFAARSIDSGERRHVWIAAICAAFAFLTRYAGLAVLMAGMAGLLLCGRAEKLKRRVGRAISFLLVSSLPMGLWLLRNQLVAGSATERQIAYHRLYSVHFLPALDTVARWMLPGLETGILRTAGVVAAALLSLFVMAVFALAEIRGQNRVSESETLRCLPHILSLFLVSFAAVLIFAKVFVDPNFPFNDRILSPAFAIATVLVWCLCPRALARIGREDAGGWTKLGRPVFIAAAALLLASHLGTTAAYSLRWLARTHNVGLGYQSVSWRTSALVHFPESLPGDAVVFSNAEDGLIFSTGHPAWRLPGAEGAASRSTSEGRPSWVQEMERKLGNKAGYVVYFDAITWRQVVTIDQLGPYFELEGVLETAEGEVVRIAGAKAAPSPFESQEECYETFLCLS